MTPFLVCAFDKSTLSNLVKECFGSFFPEIFSKKQINYLYRYLKDLGAKTVLLEREYVDKDYLEDFSRYYVKCFSNDGHKCARLHFFSEELTHNSLESLISNHEGAAARLDLNSKYLGFIVIKPLPQTFIGKTCLKLYSNEKEKEKEKENSTPKAFLFRNYDVDLFGIKLNINSIAFQEQDKVVSACATTSIWSALHAMKSQNLRDIPACSEITTNAINHIDGSSNNFPNKELSNKQILRALDIERLRHYATPLLSISTQKDFFDTVRCHIDSGIPLILGVDVYNIETLGGLRKLAGHAVTVLGYKYDDSDQTIYLHDDRLGPYARASFRQVRDFGLPMPNEGYSLNSAQWGLVLQEKNDEGDWQDPQEFLQPCSLIIPTHRKVRLPALLAKNTCEIIISEYDRWLQELEKDAAIIYTLKYELKLEEISTIRQRVISSPPSSLVADQEELRREKIGFLTGSYARYQWVATFYLNNVAAFSLLIDATDIPQGNVISYILTDDYEAAKAILPMFRNFAKTAAGTVENTSRGFFGSFLKYLTPKAADYQEYLDATYGELRAPKYLKPMEVQGGRVNDNDSVRKFYDSSSKSLDQLFADKTSNAKKTSWIWTIAHDGALLIGEEVEDMGHPTLTGFKPARIAGELKNISGKWYINSKSGRYSGDYSNRDELLNNALKKISSIFPVSATQLAIELQSATNIITENTSTS